MKSSNVTLLSFSLAFSCWVLLGLVRVDGQILFVEDTTADLEGVYQSDHAFADIDLDQDLDLVISGRNSGSGHVTRLYKNDGTGKFSLVSNPGLSGASGAAIAFADVDRDNDPDLLITGQNSGGPLVIISRLYENDGSGAFSQVSGTPFSAVQNGSVAFADVDGNQTPDLVITGDNVGADFIAELYTADTLGNFSKIPATNLQGVRYSDIAFTDVDGDQDQDLIITGLAFSNPGSSYIANLYMNDGVGNFTIKTGTPFIGVAYSAVAIADVDGDLDQDIFIAGGGSAGGKTSTLYLNDGQGNFSISSAGFTPVDKAAAAFSDVDQDGDSDLLLSGEGAIIGRLVELYENDGSGNFSPVSGQPFQGVGNGSVAFADVDGDLDEDLVIAGEEEGGVYKTRLYLNNTTTTSMDPQFHGSVLVFPNPAQDHLVIKRKGEPLALSISIQDLEGRLLWKKDYLAASTIYFPISLEPGCYLLRISSGNKSTVQKLIVR